MSCMSLGKTSFSALGPAYLLSSTNDNPIMSHMPSWVLMVEKHAYNVGNWPILVTRPRHVLYTTITMTRSKKPPMHGTPPILSRNMHGMEVEVHAISFSCTCAVGGCGSLGGSDGGMADEDDDDDVDDDDCASSASGTTAASDCCGGSPLNTTLVHFLVLIPGTLLNTAMIALRSDLGSPCSSSAILWTLQSGRVLPDFFIHSVCRAYCKPILSTRHGGPGRLRCPRDVCRMPCVGTRTFLRATW